MITFNIGDKVKGVVDGEPYTGRIESVEAVNGFAPFAVMFDRQVVICGDFADGMRLRWDEYGLQLVLRGSTIEAAR